MRRLISVFCVVTAALFATVGTASATPRQSPPPDALISITVSRDCARNTVTASATWNRTIAGFAKMSYVNSEKTTVFTLMRYNGKRTGRTLVKSGERVRSTLPLGANEEVNIVFSVSVNKMDYDFVTAIGAQSCHPFDPFGPYEPTYLG